MTQALLMTRLFLIRISNSLGGYGSAFSPHSCARVMQEHLPPEIKRAQGMPGEGLTHGPPATKKLAAVTTGSARSSGIPCAMVLTVSFVLSPGTGLSCSRHLRIDPQA